MPEDKKIEELYDERNQNSFNESPHENAAMALPDSVDGLAELFYGAIDKAPPEYIDRSLQAAEIEIKISAINKEGHRYYNITWNKPWSEEDILYTLVAYDENEEVVGAIKSIYGNERAKAVIGAAVITTDRYIHWMEGDYWTKFEKLRFRVVVTFPDGSAVVSKSVDRRFK